MNKLINMGIAALLVGVSFSAFAQDEKALVVNQDFQSLFNNYRYAQPKNIPWAGSFYPYGENGTAVGIQGKDRDKDDSTNSPMYKYDRIYNGGQSKATKFEMENHSCDHLSGADKTSCEGWWGHCNGWASAALKEAEPRKTITFKGVQLEVGHQKGILSELWLSSTSYFVGDTDKSKTTGSWVFDINDPNYAKFWDVSPRQLFLIFTNQVGAMKVGVNIDRFTGDQVWNQPIAGYLVLPIRQQDLGVQQVNGKTLNYADIRMKIYWADDGVQVDHLSNPIKIDPKKMGHDMEDDPIPSDYAVRLLRFKLFFDQPLQVSANGEQILNNPKIVGNGIWQKQEEEDYSELDQGHPDFIWQPINPRIVNDGYANPYINWKNIQEITAFANQDGVTPPVIPPVIPPVTPPVPPTVVVPPVVDPGDLEGGPNVFTAVVEAGQVAVGADKVTAQKLITKVFKRAGLNIRVNAAHIKIVGTKVQFRMFAADGVTAQDVSDAFTDVGAKVISIQ